MGMKGKACNVSTSSSNKPIEYQNEKEIFGIMIHMLYLMGTHSSHMINYSAAKFTHFLEDKSFFHVEESSRTVMQRKVYFM